MAIEETWIENKEVIVQCITIKQQPNTTVNNLTLSNIVNTLEWLKENWIKNRETISVTSSNIGINVMIVKNHDGKRIDMIVNIMYNIAKNVKFDIIETSINIPIIRKKKQKLLVK